mgnify:CR=1 FL=1
MSATGEDGLPALPKSHLVDEVIGPVVKGASEGFPAEPDRFTVDDLSRRSQPEMGPARRLENDFTI